jgi:hypothetical protein
MSDSRSMSTAKLKRLQSAGWKTGSARDFLQLSDEDAVVVVELTPPLADTVRQPRQKRAFAAK